MIRRTALFISTALALASLPAIAPAATADAALGVQVITTLDNDAAAGYRAIFDQIDGKKWADAKTAILALDENDSMRPFLLARLYLAKDSPRVELFDLLELINKAPYLPQADKLTALAAKRGAQVLPNQPQVQKLVWMGGSPQRRNLSAVKNDPIADAIRSQVAARVSANDGAGAEAALAGAEYALSREGFTELQHRVGWCYYVNGDPVNARRMAARAIETGAGDYVSWAWWTTGLSAWREKDFNGAAQAFYKAATEARDGDMRSGGYFWSARATMADHHPERVNALLKAAAKESETFYGLLAAEQLGLSVHETLNRDAVTPADWAQLKTLPNARNAVIMMSLGRTTDAEQVLRREAELTGDVNYAALVHLASELSLPTTQLWLAQRSADGRKAGPYSRFPSPDWTPANGWQVDKALVYAHALQETRFQTDARSTADARGLLQVVPSTGKELAAQAGMSFTTEQLYDPSVNLALGQLYMKKLAAMPATGGMLVKVVAAYNAGPTPVDRWNSQVRDEGDPLLFIESVPFYETRAYLNAVLRNYFVYQMEETGQSPVLKAMAQGMWTRFPDGKKTIALRAEQPGGRTGRAD
ncbi:MAG: lytic transglycosylase domain-containing protein [Sphingobium sp.]|nr:lytic transglycosylase domain-containing protein [Sphingobium sp.]